MSTTTSTSTTTIATTNTSTTSTTTLIPKQTELPTLESQTISRFTTRFDNLIEDHTHKKVDAKKTGSYGTFFRFALRFLNHLFSFRRSNDKHIDYASCNGFILPNNRHPLLVIQKVSESNV